MGQVCAKNEAGSVATDAPKPRVQRNNELTSSQAKAVSAAPEKKFVDGEIAKPEDGKDPADLAKGEAEAWCALEADWEYTGVYELGKVNEDGAHQAIKFEVSRKAKPAPAAAAAVPEQPAADADKPDSKIEEEKK